MIMIIMIIFKGMCVISYIIVVIIIMLIVVVIIRRSGPPSPPSRCENRAAAPLPRRTDSHRAPAGG